MSIMPAKPDTNNPVFELKDKEGTFFIDLKTVVQSIQIAEIEGCLETIPETWLKSIPDDWIVEYEEVDDE